MPPQNPGTGFPVQLAVNNFPTGISPNIFFASDSFILVLLVIFLLGLIIQDVDQLQLSTVCQISRLRILPVYAKLSPTNIGKR